MRAFFIRLGADFIAFFHIAVMALLLTGWLLPEPYYYVYLAALAITFVTQVMFRYCILTLWEFQLRRILDPALGPSPYYLTYYSHKFFPGWVTDEFVDRISLIFMAVSLMLAALRLMGVFG